MRNNFNQHIGPEKANEAGIFCFSRQFSFCFQVSHFIPIHKIRKRGYQIQQIQFAMQKAASNTRKTITVSHSAIRHFLARLHSLVTAVAAGISVALTVLTAGAAATAIASKSTTAAGWKHCTPTARPSALPPASRCRPGKLSAMSDTLGGLRATTYIWK